MLTKNKFLQRKRKSYSPERNNEKNKEDINVHKKNKFIIQKNFDVVNNKHEIEQIIEDSFKLKEDSNKSEIRRNDYILKEIEMLKNKSNEELKELINKNRLETFMEKEEYDFFLFRLMKYISSILSDNKIFKEDYTNYIYNNLRVLQDSKELDDILKKVAYNHENEFLFMEFLKFSNLRWEKFIKAAEKYNIDLYEQYIDSINPEKKNRKKEIKNGENKEKFDINKTIEIYRNFPEENQLELFVAGIVYNSMIKNEQEENKNNLDNNLIIEDKLEIQNFNLGEMPMISVLTGIKYNKNIIEIILSGNSLSPKCLFWLGSCIKTLPFLSYIDISRCNIDNDKLYMFIEGSKFSNENLNKEQFNLKKLNLKDNPDIIDNDNKNSKFEHPISLILEKFKLERLNLTNSKLCGKGAIKIFKKMNELLDENKLYLENLIMIGNEIKNEICLSELGDLLIKDNCPLKKLILSKNMISTYPMNCPNHNINYFRKFMNCVAESKLEELFLINCDIGNYEEDINILCEMLKKNKSLTSIRLFGNKINNMKSFSEILGIFSDYNKQLENSTLKSIDLGKNQCNLKIDEDFMRLIENLKLEYLDINQNTMQNDGKEIFKKRTNELSNIRIIY